MDSPQALEPLDFHNPVVFDTKEDLEEAPTNFPTSCDPDDDAHSYNLRTLCDEDGNVVSSYHFQSQGSLDVELLKDGSSIHGHCNPRVIQCLTCSNYKSSFYCYGCIKHGDFCSSKSSCEIEERFAEKKLKYYLNLQVKSTTLSEISNLLQGKVQVDTLETEIKRRKRYICRLKSLLHQKKSVVEVMRQKQSQLVEAIKNEQKLRMSKEFMGQKIEFVKKRISEIETRTKQKGTMNKSNINGIKELTWDLSYQLRSNIFTLEIYAPDENESSLSNSEESVPLLGHYSVYGFDHISSQSNPNETKYTVIEPWIPASADIMPYVMWVNRHKVKKDEATSVESFGMRNDAFRTSAALANLCQMTQVLSGILDLWLPRRLAFREFFSKPGHDGEFLTEEELRNKVAKLNTNVSYLCLSQKLDPDLVNVRQSVKNIINLLNPSLPSELGRRGPVELDPDFLSNLESALSVDLQLIEESMVCYYSSQDCDQDLELDFDMIPNWPGGPESLPSPSEINLTGSYLPSPGILTSVFSRMFTRE